MILAFCFLHPFGVPPKPMGCFGRRMVQKAEEPPGLT